MGMLIGREGKEVTLQNSKRIWYWDGAASLSQLAAEGTKKPNNCKIPAAVSKIILTEAIEIIAMTDQAIESIEKVPTWAA